MLKTQGHSGSTHSGPSSARSVRTPSARGLESTTPTSPPARRASNPFASLDDERTVVVPISRRILTSTCDAAAETKTYEVPPELLALAREGTRLQASPPPSSVDTGESLPPYERTAERSTSTPHSLEHAAGAEPARIDTAVGHSRFGPSRRLQTWLVGAGLYLVACYSAGLLLATWR